MSQIMIQPKLKRPKIRNPLKCYGGKSYLALAIHSLVPASSNTFVDLFGGGGSMTLNARPFTRQIYNDVDWFRSNVFQCLHNVERYRQLYPMLTSTTYTESHFNAALEAMAIHRHIRQVNGNYAVEPIEAARDYIVTNRMSRGGMGKAFAWSKRKRGGRPGDVNGWHTFLDQLPQIHERLRPVEILGLDWETVFDMYCQSDPASIAYMDPPYPKATRTATEVYDHEFTDEQHLKMIQRAAGAKGKIIISGYHCPMYDKNLADWNVMEIDMPNNASQDDVKSRRVECVWYNYDLT